MQALAWAPYLLFCALLFDDKHKVQLTEIIPQLVQLTTGRQYPLFGKDQYKPDWWPDSTPWLKPEAPNRNLSQEQVGMLKELVVSCYKHLGQESLLDVCTEHKPENEEPIWVCFLCAKQFMDQELLMEHQDQCEKEQELQEAKERLERLNREKERLDRLSQESQRLADLKKQREIVTRQRKVQYREKLNMHRVNIQRQRELLHREEQEVMSRTPRIQSVLSRQKRKRIKPELYIPPPKPVFIQNLGLKERPKNDNEESALKKDADSDCEIVEVSLPEGVVAPLTPRTPRSLMSQLSRDPDAHVRRRHLSFAGIVSDSDSGDESLENEAKKKPSAALSSLLFGIDLTSALGQRVKKHLKINNEIPITKNYEQFCKGPEKNEFIEKLRQSDRSYPVVYKARRKCLSKYCHEYKFNSADRREYIFRKKTGLTKRSRGLLKYVKFCKVTLKRLKASVIKEWTRPKPKPKPVMHRPLHPSLTLNDPQLRQILSRPLYGPRSARVKQINQNLMRLRAAQAASGADSQYDMVTRIVRNVDGTETMKIIYVPKQNPSGVRSAGPFPRPMMPMNRRKQSFHPSQLRQSDEEIQIIELSSSSDEEEDAKKCNSFTSSQHNVTAKPANMGPARPLSLHRNTAVRQRVSPASSQRGPVTPRSAVFTSTGLQFISPSSLPPLAPKPKGMPVTITSAAASKPSGLSNVMHTGEGLPFTSIQNLNSSRLNAQIDLNSTVGKSDHIKINPLPDTQKTDTFQGVMRTVIGPDGQMRVQCEPAVRPKPLVRRIAPKPVESNKPDEAIVLDDDDD
ncbi:hypothetical protein FSP39_008333 [Pinctada imbricata]|uniref:Nuclear respiratory factor 1 NLS/DNA-binding dimerisation domain-containing protein n=1 Tax=Pinctada imbricata TaxID=66713 RepID=A0AA88YCB2_PINIB|nr:hypothetical protein FSP39_008333 [Pinctada imbricata]